MCFDATYPIYNYTIITKRWQTIFYTETALNNGCIETVHPL